MIVYHVFGDPVFNDERQVFDVPALIEFDDPESYGPEVLSFIEEDMAWKVRNYFNFSIDPLNEHQINELLHGEENDEEKAYTRRIL